MKKRTALSISILIHLILGVSLTFVIWHKKPPQTQPHRPYFVDIVELPAKTPSKTPKEIHKLASNVNRKAISHEYSKKEKLPMKTTKKLPSEHIKTTTNMKKQFRAPNLGRPVITKIPSQKTNQFAKPKHTPKKQPPRVKTHGIHTQTNRIVRIPGSFFSSGINPKALFSRKPKSGFSSGTSKKYKSPNVKEATVSIGTTSIKYSSYMQHIKNKIQNVWVYPEYARENNEQGSLLILFTIGKDGNLKGIKLLRSSGYKSLDRAAIEAVKEAAPFPPLPKRLGIDKLNIYATFVYTLVFYSIR